MLVDLHNIPSKVAVLFSGGVESTLLYWYTTQVNQSFDLFIIDRNNKPIERGLNLYELLKTEFNDRTSTITVLEYPELDGRERVDAAISEIMKTHDAILFGINAYPPDIIPNESYRFGKKYIESQTHLITPFINTTKDEIIQEYYNQGIERILPLTHSCGRADSPCQQCFNCKERIWAYKKLKKDVNLGIWYSTHTQKLL